MKNLRGAAAKAPGTEPAKNGSLAPAGLVLATPGETFYGQVRRCLGDRRFVVDNVATGCMVPCRLKGSMGRQWVGAEDWVLVSMRAYEKDNQYNERKGEILKRYDSHQVRANIYGAFCFCRGLAYCHRGLWSLTVLMLSSLSASVKISATEAKMIQRLADWMRTKATRKMFLCVCRWVERAP